MKKSSEVKFTERKLAIQKDNECERKFYLVLPCRNLVGGFIKQCFGSRQRSVSFLSFLPRSERPLLAGKQNAK